jgi:hypothetical protein
MRRLRVLAGFALLLLAAPAAAQTTMGTMQPLNGAAPAAKAGKLPRADAFKNLAAAQAHCPGDVVVWSTLTKSKSFHLAGSRYYGKTKHGAYVCKADALEYGFHQAKS